MTSLLCRLAAACAAVLLVLWPVEPARADPLTAADFVEPAALTGASLSPSGRYLVWVVRAGGENEIHVRDLETGEVRRMAAGASREHFGGVFVEWVAWKSDDRLLLALTRLELRRRGDREDGRIRSITYGRVVISLARDGSNSIALKAPRSDDTDPGEVLDTLQNDPDHILMTYRNAGGALDVARVNVLTGAAEKILGGHRRVLSYVTDNSGAIVGRVAYRGMTGRVLLLEALNADGAWSEVYRLRRDEVRDLPDYEFLGATARPGQIYVTVQPKVAEGPDTAGVHIFDFRTREMGPAIWRHDRYDVSGIVLDPDTHEMLAGCYWADIYRCDFADRQDDAVMSGIRRFFGDGWSVSVVSQARDGSRWLVQASAPNNPGEYYLFNVAERRMEPLGAIYPKLPEGQLGVMRRVDYTASDGQALFGYLTRPAGAAPDAKLPLVVLPHGGPEMRDFMAYDMWVQFLTTRGYQVFQPNFRGSSGMGRGFAEAGYRQWGLRMQDDITEGVQALFAQGVAEPGQVCIVGASYGGYAALQGGATQPDLYRCAVSIAGPSDLMTMLRWERSEGGADSDRYEYWVRSIGDPRADQAAIEAASPLRRADSWRIPLLLIHGEEDEVVPVAQSRTLERALRRAGKPVRFVELEGAEHNGWSRAQEITVMTEMEAFLREHMPVPAPAASASAVEPQVEAAPAA